MNIFSLIIIGAHNGSGLEELILNQTDKVLLIEPVKYNLQSLKKKFKEHNNIYFENIGISDLRDQIKFYHVKENSIKKLVLLYLKFNLSNSNLADLFLFVSISR